MEESRETTNPTVVTDQSPTNPPQSEVCSVKKKPFKSAVWEHCTKIYNGKSKTPIGASCNYCDRRYGWVSVNGTSTLKTHLKKCHKFPYNKDKNQKVLTFSKSSSSLGNWIFDQHMCRDALAKMVIVDELSFKFVEHEGFRKFCDVMQPKFKLVSRMSVARDCVLLYEGEKNKLESYFKEMDSRVCLTSDTWTSLQNLSYLCLTAHFIDKDWKLHKRIINFSVISSHRGEAIGQVVESCIIKWGFEKLGTITLDNATANDVAVGYLKRKISNRCDLLLDGKFFHVRCCAHIINLIVRDGMGEVNDSISCIRGAVKYVRSSPTREQRFKQCVEKEGITFKHLLCLDVQTRWNSTFLMLETALKFQKAFERFEEEDPLYVRELKDKPPSYIDWENARILSKFLSKFNDVTKRLSGTSFVTSSIYFHEICGIESTLNDMMKNTDSCLVSMATKMKEKFDKYWGNIDNVNMLLLVALVLDPRYKLKYVNFCYGKVYPLERVAGLTKKVREFLDMIFLHYRAGHSFSSPSANTTPMDVDQSNVTSSEDANSLHDEFLKHLEEQEGEEMKSEVDRYLEEKCEKNDNFEILTWWKLNSCRYTILSQVVRDILAIPVSIVASESAFSTSGRVLDAFRSSLTPKLVESLICCQDWLRASPIAINIEENIEDLQEFEHDMVGAIYLDG